jgi:hypothetical protein
MYFLTAVSDVERWWQISGEILEIAVDLQHLRFRLLFGVGTE